MEPSKADEESNKNNGPYEEFTSTNSEKDLISANKYDGHATEFILEPTFQIELAASTNDGQTNKENSIDEQSSLNYNKTMEKVTTTALFSLIP